MIRVVVIYVVVRLIDVVIVIELMRLDRVVGVG
jgi:hypothetical protein